MTTRTTSEAHPTLVTDSESEHQRTLRAVPAESEGTNAGARALARASESANANSDQASRANPDSPTDGDTNPSKWTRLKTWASPPNPKTTPPPTWDQLRWHGEHGRQAPKTGWPRTISIAWCYTVAQPGRALAVWLDWISRSPSRCLVAFVLYVLLAHVPGLTWLPWFY